MSEGQECDAILDSDSVDTEAERGVSVGAVGPPHDASSVKVQKKAA
jgi:hypothetical protein